MGMENYEVYEYKLPGFLTKWINSNKILYLEIEKFLFMILLTLCILWRIYGCIFKVWKKNVKGGDHNVSTAALCVLLSREFFVILLTSNKYGFSRNFENSREFLKDLQNLTCACLYTKSKVQYYRKIQSITIFL